MASFFQPGENDPAIAACPNRTFDVYCNGILPENDRLREWYQYVTLYVGAVSLAVPVALLLLILVPHLWVSSRDRRARRAKGNQDGHSREGVLPPLPALKQVRSFCVIPETAEIFHLQEQHRRFDLVVRSITLGTHSPSATAEPDSAVSSSRKQIIFVSPVDQLHDLSTSARIASVADVLAKACKSANASGIALQIATGHQHEQVEKLLTKLHNHKVQVIVLAHHDLDIWPSLDLTTVAGVIMQNSCILPNGERRDYFRSRPLRDLMGRCGKERESRPELFVGFLEYTDAEPHPSVVRRAVKLAEHFGAIVSHGCKFQGFAHMLSNGTETLSGFEYLRRQECTELQKNWRLEVKKPWVGKGVEKSTAVQELPVKSLEDAIDGISSLLSYETVQEAQEVATLLEPPYTMPSDEKFGSTSFWERSANGLPVSSRGCFALTTEPSELELSAVVDTQLHLKRLSMLQPVEGAEKQRLIDSFRKLVQAGDCNELVHGLVNGLKTNQVCIYKGLDTGFGIPDGDSHFWGVSHARDDLPNLCIDLFISLKAPNDATTILHTWLAHCGVSRSERFETEIEYEKANRMHDSCGLPISVKTAIERSSYSEVLSLLQQVYLTNLDRSLRDPITSYCRHVLINDTSLHQWTQFQARKVLDRSVGLEDILKERLLYYRRKGATQLPVLANLVHLYDQVETVILESLFYGQRTKLNTMISALATVYDAENMESSSEYVDINSDFFALIFFTALKRAAFEEVYIEATDRCPIFLPQPDQAAVFSELWVLGSQCEIYFGILPRDLGEIVYNRYRDYLQKNPPAAEARQNNEIMSMYADAPSGPGPQKNTDRRKDGASFVRTTSHEKLQMWQKRLTELGAMSIFCLPAIIDVVLLTFVGRGLFMTAFMNSDHLKAASYALVISLLLTAGVTGWVGSTGNYYIASYAYDNMIFFHISRLSGGFVLTLVVSIGGFIGFTLSAGVDVGFVFVAFLVAINTYFNLLGIMATMHQHGSPMTSGRTVIWRTIPLLLISPILTSFVNGHDLEIYLPVMYTFLFLLLFQYRGLCHEWSGWLNNIPDITEKSVMDWYAAQPASLKTSEDQDKNQTKVAQAALREAVAARTRRTGYADDEFVDRVAHGMPYVAWLFKKAVPGGSLPEEFTASWFTQLGEAVKQQRQLSRGLKEHNTVMLFRHAKYDIGQNLGLFLVALMDRWVSIVMSSRQPSASIYTNARSRYAICLCILYFCFSVMLLDTTLQKYWEIRFKLSTEKLIDYEHAQNVRKKWDVYRLKTFLEACFELISKILFIFGSTTMLLWILVDAGDTTSLYYLYALGYTCVIIFQFNRCFTTNVRAHITIILSSASVGFLVGILLHAIPGTAGWLYNDIVAQNTAGLLAVIGTTLFVWKDWASPDLSADPKSVEESSATIFAQRRISADSIDAGISPSQVRFVTGTVVQQEDGSYVSQRVPELLHLSISQPSPFALKSSQSKDILDRAVQMWVMKKLSITCASREDFMSNGLTGVSSFSQRQGDVLHITIGFLGSTELRVPSWQMLLSTLIAESILYHIARSEFQSSHSAAVQAEHFLHGTEDMSRRIDFEINFEEVSRLNRIERKTNAELMKHLCLDVPVDSGWAKTPEDVREVILARVLGEKVSASETYLEWLTSSKTDLTAVNFHLDLTLRIFERVQERIRNTVHFSAGHDKSILAPSPAELMCVEISKARAPRSLVQHWLRMAVAIPFEFVKWIAVLTGAGSDIERELWYLLQDTWLGGAIVWTLLLIWGICRILKNLWVYIMFVYGRHNLTKIIRVAKKGARRTIFRNRVVVELPRKTITGFASSDDDCVLILDVYDGALKETPSDKKPMFKAIYDDQFRLKGRVDNGTTCSTYRYVPGKSHRWPVSKEVVDGPFRMVGFYDKFGRVTRGTLTLGDSEFAFQYHYKSQPKNSPDVLAADFKLANSDSEDMLSVFWGVPLEHDSGVYNWVPSEKICRIVKYIDGRVYTTEAEYPHKRDPIITTYLSEEDGSRTAIAKAPELFTVEAVLLARPHNLSFDLDDLLIYYNPIQIRNMRHFAGTNTSLLFCLNPLAWVTWYGRKIYRTVPTWRIRTELWNDWLKSGTLDAVTACWLDELVLREEPLLKPYWRARDGGRMLRAKEALDRNIDQIVSAIEIDSEVSEVSLLHIRTSDLYAMGLGKDATQVTTRPEDCYQDTPDRISVIFNDIGCWPEAPGGVSNCRRDLVNGHSTIRNHVLAECANDFGIPRFQIEKNVQSLKLLPLWGLDGKSAHHGLIDNLLQAQVDRKFRDTDVQRDIVGVFIPLLKEFVRGARTKKYSRADLIKFSNVMLSMSKYYELKDYKRTWESREVEEAWVDAWLLPSDDPNIMDPASCFAVERPSMSDFREALAIYLAYFFIFSVQIPDRCPRVFQSTHHGISSLFGMILKHRRGVTFGIWDHAILWRECCLNISPAQCELPLAVQSMLLSGIGMATRLAYFHADVIMPCTSLFNPMWETEIGTDRGDMGSKSVFNRRIDPIVNGIAGLDSWSPVDKVRTEKPTVVMLSNVQFIKGIKTAVLAADIIVNRWGFKDYQLVVYGAKDRQPSYALEMAKLIVENNLSENVLLAGFGKPKEVLKDAWLFMNSSISEGLPLAIGEAALAGVPIVATEVGATALVLTDPMDQDQRYGEVVPPNDPLALARAQISMLSMVGPWAKFTSDGDRPGSSHTSVLTDSKDAEICHLELDDETNQPEAGSTTLPDEITSTDVTWLTERMYAKSEDRRKLGLLSRQVVLHSFHGNRYLREHEQMYWIQWHHAQMRQDKGLVALSSGKYKFGSVPQPRYAGDDVVPAAHVDAVARDRDSDEFELLQRGISTLSGNARWQDFEKTSSHGSDRPRAPRRLSKKPHRTSTTGSTSTMV